MNKYKCAGYTFVALALTSVLLRLPDIIWATNTLSSVMCFIASDYFEGKKS